MTELVFQKIAEAITQHGVYLQDNITAVAIH